MSVHFLAERVKRANTIKSEIPKIYLSIHSNAAPVTTPDNWCDPKIRGVETYYADISKRSKELATVFQKHLVEHTGLRDRGVKSDKNYKFTVLRTTVMPAVLTETGFYNNPIEVKLLLQPAFRQKSSRCSCKCYFRNRK